MYPKSLRKNSDLFGIVSSSLCLIHCIAFPVFFAFSSLSVGFIDHHVHWLEYIFVLLAIMAVYYSTSKITSKGIKSSMWVSISIFGTAMLMHELSEIFIYISILASIGLVVLHIINYRYCKGCKL